MNQPSEARRQQWLEQVDSALRSYGLDAAAKIALQALADGVEEPAVLNLAAQARYAEGAHEDAVELLQRARLVAPHDPHVLNSLGICLAAVGRTDEALGAYDDAIRADPASAATYFNRGALLEQLSDLPGAKAAFERAAALDRNYPAPLASLAWLDAQAGDPEGARTNAERALALVPTNVLARMALAAADLQRKDLRSATMRLAALVRDQLSPVNRSIVLGLVGDFRDADGRAADAFEAYSVSNSLLQELYAARFEKPGAESALGQARRLTEWFETTDAAPWRHAPAAMPSADGPKAHVFLVGFPRSGTTLLENVLAAHPDVVSLEEKDCFSGESAAHLASAEGLERLANFGPSEAKRQREAYWSKVRAFGAEPSGRVFIDKMPLASMLLPLVAKLFPDARVLFALRDPRDVVLSCFRRRFGMNPAMYQLLTLDGAAAYYDAVMRLSEVYREILPLPQHFVRYESIVEDFEGTTREVCGFLGLEWNRSMADFAAKARTRGISTPSAAQVARGLNREGQGAWRRYSAEMAPVLSILEPWVRRFGYE